MTNTIFLISCLLAFLSSTTSYANENLKSIFESRVHDGHLCPRGSSWIKTKNMYLKVSSEKLKISASYDTKNYENYDMKLILSDSSLTNGDSFGEAILLAGRVLLTKNIQINENHAIDVLDGAALFQQLAFTLLELVAEKGPENTTLPFHQEIFEPIYPIKATTQSASSIFGAPWKAKIDLLNAEKGSISYKLYFTFILEGGEETDIQMEGILSNYGKININPTIPDNFGISDWKQYNIGPYTKKMETGTIYDFGTTFLETPYATLGELRKYIQEKYKQ